MIEDTGELVLVVSVPILLAVSLAAVFGYGTLAVVLSILGFVGFVPLVVVFDDRLLERMDPSERDEPEPDDPLAALRVRYARGELTEDAFEREVERVLADDDSSSAGSEVAGTAAPDRERELEP